MEGFKNGTYTGAETFDRYGHFYLGNQVTIKRDISRELRNWPVDFPGVYRLKEIYIYGILSEKCERAGDAKWNWVS